MLTTEIDTQNLEPENRSLISPSPAGFRNVLKVSNLLLHFPHFYCFPLVFPPVFFLCCIPRNCISCTSNAHNNSASRELWMKPWSETPANTRWIGGKKRVKNSPGTFRCLLAWGRSGNKNENIKNCTTVGRLHYAIYLLFDILIPKSRIMQTGTRHVYSHKYLSLHKKCRFCQFNWIMINFAGI